MIHHRIAPHPAPQNGVHTIICERRTSARVTEALQEDMDVAGVSETQ